MSNGPEERPSQKPKLIAEYLFFIGRFTSAYERHRSSPEEAKAAMIEFGLDSYQRDVVLSESNKTIQDAVQAELDFDRFEEPSRGIDAPDSRVAFFMHIRVCVTCLVPPKLIPPKEL
jgi:hypothetical protein